MLSLELRDLTKRYNRRRVFQGLNARIQGGESLVVTGPNGSGKSTLLRLVCGLVRPTGGQVVVTVGDRALSPIEARDHLGLVAPDLALYGELSGLENLRFFARVRGLRVTEEGLQGLLRQVGLEGRGDDMVAAYSSGMRQRLKYAFALLHRPSLLALDEPGTNLDDAGRAMMAQVIASQKAAGGMLVLATNDPQEVSFGDQVLRLGP